MPPTIRTSRLTRRNNPLLGSALAATSGIARPAKCPGLIDRGTLPFCQLGTGMMSLMPPPVPLPGPSFHTTSVIARCPFALLRACKRRAADRQDIGARRREVDVRTAVLHLRLRAVVAGRNADT